MKPGFFAGALLGLIVMVGCKPQETPVGTSGAITNAVSTNQLMAPQQAVDPAQ